MIHDAAYGDDHYLQQVINNEHLHWIVYYCLKTHTAAVLIISYCVTDMRILLHTASLGFLGI